MKVSGCMIVQGLLALSMLLVSVQEVDAETTQFAYGVNAGDWSVTQYRVNPETGVLRHNGHLPIYKFPAAVAVDHSKRFVIAAVKTGNKVAVFRIDPASGLLTEIPQSPFSVAPASGVITKSPYAISIHPSGRFVYVAARWGGVIVFEMDEKTGVLTQLPDSPFAAQKRTRSVKVHPSGRFVYASNAYSNSISAYRVNQENGALTPVPGSPFDTGEVGFYTAEELRKLDAPPEAGGVPYRVEIHPSGRFIYVTNRAGPSLSMFKVDTDSGALTPLKGSPLELVARPYGVDIHPSGRFLYVTGWDIGAVWGFAIDEDSGQLTPLSEPLFDTEGFAPISVSFNAEGTRAYVPNVFSNSISQFSVNTDNGKLKLVETVRTRYQPFEITLLDMPPVKREPPFAYVITNKQGQPAILRENAESGLSTSVNVSENKPLSTQVSSATVADPLGRFLYMAYNAGGNDKENGIAVYRIDTTNGELTPLPDYSIHLGFTPTDLAIDTSGRFLYAINPSIDILGLFSVDPESGALSSTRRQLPKIGKESSSIALDPVARYSFVANAKENTVSIFSHERMHTPAIYPFHPEEYIYATGKTPVALVVDPTGKFLLVANKGSNNVSVFNIHFHEGQLEAVKGSPFASGKAPVSVAIHPNGKFVYVVNAESGSISAYRLDTMSGKLSVVPMRVDAGRQPQTIAISSNGLFAYVRNKGSGTLRKYAVDVKSGRLTYSGLTDVGRIVSIAR